MYGLSSCSLALMIMSKNVQSPVLTDMRQTHSIHAKRELKKATVSLIHQGMTQSDYAKIKAIVALEQQFIVKLDEFLTLIDLNNGLISQN